MRIKIMKHEQKHALNKAIREFFTEQLSAGKLNASLPWFMGQEKQTNKTQNKIYRKAA